jgi:hypothetical protein
MCQGIERIARKISNSDMLFYDLVIISSTRIYVSFLGHYKKLRAW